MPKLPDDTVYMKVDGKFIPIGRQHNIDLVGYGCYFVESKKYSRGIRRINGVPSPDFVGLETAARMCTDEIVDTFWKKVDKGTQISSYDIGQALTEAIISTANKHKKLLLDTIKEGCL
jgi:hypothetical protein